MGYRLTKIVTRTGDKGTTGLGDGSRVNKDHLRICAIGDIDELNSLLGLLLTCPEIPDPLRQCLAPIQHHLFDLGGELSIPETQQITHEHVTKLEKLVDRFNKDLPPLKEFILPGGHQAAAMCHLARAICRRAEREMVRLHGETLINPASLAYINRLSDLLFISARVICRATNTPEVTWQRS